MSQAWRLETVRGLSLVRCVPLDAVPGIAHGFSTRLGDGGNGFDLGPAGTASQEIQDRRRRFLECAGLASERAPILRQVHGANIVRAATCEPGTEADAAIWSREDGGAVAAAVRTADCVPILLCSEDGDAVAAVHAGWRGTAARIAAQAVEALREAGFEPKTLVAALGPAILGCCYVVGGEVAAAVRGVAEPGGSVHLDLHEANRAQLVEAGVPPDRVHGAPWCTRCRADLFFSHRRDGAATGRMMAAIGPRHSP